MSQSWTPVNQGFPISTSPALCKNKANWFLLAPALFQMGCLASNCGLSPAAAIKETAVYSKPATYYNTPVGECEKCIPSLIVGYHHRSTLVWKYHIKKKKKHYQAQWTDLVLFARQPQVWLCWRGNSCCTCLHQAAAHLRVSPTAPASKAPLPLCGIPVALCEFRLTKPKTQPQLILFISTHHTSIHSHSSVSGGIYTPSSAALYWSQGS